MSITSQADWTGLRAVARVVRLTLERLAAEVHAGVTTGELDRIATEVLAEHGAHSAPAIVYGFPGTVLISVNDEITSGDPIVLTGGAA
jgi:methionyl aminopeptidase